jgi:polysaccharide deacetylase family protein (PEP-CTERM system associated)
MGRLVDRAVVNGLSVDVEDYFQVSAFDGVVARSSWATYKSRVAASTDRLLALFEESGVHATFFVLGWIAERESAIVRKIAAAGHEIASHGYWHELVYRQSPREFREDVRRSRGILQEVSGQPVLGYRAPSFSITEASLWALEILAEEGFSYDASVFPIRHDRYGIPWVARHPHPARVILEVHAARRRGGRLGSGAARPPSAVSPALDATWPLLEVPASTVRLCGCNLPVSGGGYFRLLPYGWTRWGISRVNRREGRAVVFYIHPWELDPGQPRLPVSVAGRLRHYRNLSRTEDRLRKLLREFRFGPVAAVVLGQEAGTIQAGM